MADEITPAPLELPPPEAPGSGREDPVERELVDDLMRAYKTARAFDRPQLNQIARDRRYTSGQQGRDAAVNANLLGSYIDILVSFIYARNPKVSIRPAEQTGKAAQRERQLFAKTLQIVVQRLWNDGKLKKCMKRVVRAGFSVATGWWKAAMRIDTATDPLIETELNDIRDNLERIRALEEEILDPDAQPPLTKEAKVSQLELEIEGLESRVEVVLRKTMAIDFIRSDQMIVALDIDNVDDYLEAGWLGDEVFLPYDEALAKFETLTSEDLKTATCYYQKPPTTFTPNEIGAVGESIGDIDPHGEASAYTTNESYATAAATDSQTKAVKFIKVIEIWDRRDLHIKTMIEGLHRWARAPFTPKFATSRFYPYFKVDFYQVDGERWPQSLTLRLFKLQDEYAGVRSSFRTTRQRSIPGTLFNSGMLESDDIEKMKNAAHDEFIPVKPRDTGVDLRTLFTEKPQPTIDPMLFDTAPVIGDMEKISGVQEALQTSQTVDKTATQAEIEQSGFAARTTSARDCVEESLGEFARYTAELALQALTYQDVRKIAGPLAVWPENLPVEYVTTMLDVDIEAGSTGRPNTAAEREAWGVVFPHIKELLGLIIQTQGTPLATAYTELLRETLNRFDDRIDIERFLPGIVTDDPTTLNALDPMGTTFQGMPGQPGMPGAPLPAPVEGVVEGDVGAAPTGPGALPEAQADPLAAA